ncbi:MAG: hypothetical protein EAZ15_09365 [Sphingobacteriales bacterium]|nr:MAG: hypothetical protein EAZ15_09365 [Sphingobacteriales bacterium]
MQLYVVVLLQLYVVVLLQLYVVVLLQLYHANIRINIFDYQLFKQIKNFGFYAIFLQFNEQIKAFFGLLK